MIAVRGDPLEDHAITMVLVEDIFISKLFFLSSGVQFQVFLAGKIILVLSMRMSE